MNAAYIYLQLYRLFDDTTPVAVDCGQLCGSACCKDDDDGDNGMYLFPGEKEILKLLKPSWAKIERSDFSYEYEGKTYNVPIALCSGECDRYSRPLACRIFPLTPHLNSEGKMEIIIDPRAKKICPLTRLYMEDFDPAFVRNVKRCFSLLMHSRHFSAFMKEYSAYIDEYLRFFNK